MAVEEPQYSVVVTDGPFQIRDYQACIVAEVAVSGGQRAATQKGFRQLAGFIFGGNARKQAIAMTAPVGLEPQSAPAPDAPPALPAAGAWLVRFTMPQTFSLQSLPRPNDPAIRLVDVPPTRYAVLRFSGLAGPDAAASKAEQLNKWIASRRLTAKGPMTLAFYDPPWTLWFLRRNEVMVAVGR